MSEATGQKLRSVARCYLVPTKGCSAILVLSFLLSLFFNVYIFQQEEPWTFSIFGYLSSSVLLSVILQLSLKCKWIGLVVMPLVALTIVAVWYIHSVFGLYVNFEIIASICETNWDEAAPYCTWPKIMSVCFVLIAITGGVWYGNKKLSRHLRWNDFIPAILVYMASTSVFYVDWYGMNEVTPEFLGYKQAPTWPVSDIVLNQRRIRKYKRTEGYSVTDMETLPSMADAGGSCSLPDDGEITVIVYVGESVRADHLQINGYKRETTPNLMKRREQLASFKNCHSFGLLTRVSVVGLLTDAEINSRTPKYGSFISLFNRFGYETGTVQYCPATVNDLPLSVLSKSAKHHTFVPRSSKSLEDPLYVETVRQVRNLDAQIASKRKMFLLYDNGAHFPFNSHTSSKKFLPDLYPEDAPLEHISEMINAYDNNLIEIDWELDQLMKHFEKQNAVFIYISDHGVALGEKGHFAQGTFVEPVKKPAFFIWMSDRFREKHPDHFNNLKKYENMPVSQDYLLHTLLSLSGLHFSGYKPELDLTTPRAEAFDHPPTDERMMQE